MTIISVEGFIDTHVHTGPAPFRRIGDTIDVARWCREAKMTAIVIKSHFEATITKVYHARKETPDLEIYAGIALNRGVGGINPAAVEQALRQDAKVVWMPTIDAQNHVRVFGAPGAFGAIGAASYTSSPTVKDEPTYTVLNGGKLTVAAKDVIDVIADYDAVLATGHMSAEEVLALVDYAIGKNHNRIIVTHPEMQCPNLPIDVQITLAKEGCMMEYCAVNCMPMFQSVTSDQMKDAIDAVGPANAIIATDSGQPFSPKTPDMFRIFAQVLHEKGLDLDAIATMAIRNPAKLLGIAPKNDSVIAHEELGGVAQDIPPST
jgi:hypothetical protein